MSVEISNIREGLRSTRLSATVVLTLVVFGLMGVLILWTARKDYADMHIMLDTGMFLLPGVLAMLFWDMAIRIDSIFPRLLAISFAVTCALALLHVLVGIEWPVAWVSLNEAKQVLRPATWPPPSHLLSIGIAGAIWLSRRTTKRVWPFTIAMAALAVGLLALFVCYLSTLHPLCWG